MRKPSTELGTLTLGRSFQVVVLVLAVSALVAIAAKGLRLLSPATALSDAWAVGVRITGALLAGAGAAGLFYYRTKLRGGSGGSSDPTVVGVRTAATIMGVLALVALVNPPPSVEDAPGSGVSFRWVASPWGEGSDSGDAPSSGTRGGDSPIRGSDVPLDLPTAPSTPRVDEPVDRSLVEALRGVFPWLFVFVAIVIGLRALARRLARPGAETPAVSTLAPAVVEAGLEASLGEMGLGVGDPRQQITNAYGRLLSALAAAGVEREPQEAPHEHLRRALGPLGVRPDPLRLLTGLYVLAQFGRHPVTERHRAAAVDALEVSLADLRAIDLRGWTHRVDPPSRVPTP